MKDVKKLFFFLFFFFLLGTFLCFSLFQRIKFEFISNNNILAGSILKEHPELEQELILILSSPKEELLGNSVLKKYGLTSLDSIDYLNSMKDFKIIFFGTFFVFYLIFTVFLICYFSLERKKRKNEIAKIDKYLFSLLSNEIKVDLKDFQSGELETLQNDLMKVTSRLKNALEHSTSSSKELSKTLADISHQLKTPITSLSIINEALSNPSMDEKTRIDFLQRQEEVLSHMQTLVVNLLKVSQIESGMIELKKENISLPLLLQDSLDELDVLIVSKNINVEMEVPENISIIGDSIWVKEALLNIIKNGVEHSFLNGTIHLNVLENPMYVELQIEDDGCGIKKSDLPHIFERFYKSSKNTDSIGIGLNLSKSIFDRMNATVRVTSKEGVGTKFIIHFYKGVI